VEPRLYVGYFLQRTYVQHAYVVLPYTLNVRSTK